MNIKFEYIYRDAANFKNYGAIVLSNPENLSVETLRRDIEDTLCGNCFMAAQIDVPEVFLWANAPFTEDDHIWHEFLCVSETDLPCDDERTISHLIKKMREASMEGWDEERVLEPLPDDVQRAFAV